MALVIFGLFQPQFKGLIVPIFNLARFMNMTQITTNQYYLKLDHQIWLVKKRTK